MADRNTRAFPLSGLHIDDRFWNSRIGIVAGTILPYQYDMLHDDEKSHCVKNFRIAAGLDEGEFEGWVFQDSDLAKFLEAVAYSLTTKPDAELERRADELIDLVAAAQEESGYLDTCFTIAHPGKRFCNLKEGHELYTAGHFMEAAVAYFEATGKRKLLDVMKKCADNICRVFHTEEYMTGVPGHEEVELALFRLADATGESRYADMAYDFINRRGVEPNYLATEHMRPKFVDLWHDRNAFNAPYAQTHLPVREQRTAEGHAVRALYLYSGMADAAERYNDAELLKACEALYENITKKRMYITGGVGSSGTLERFTTDYDLPNDSNYCESCASVALAMFCRRMARITGEARYMDTCETALMNTVLAGVSLDGKRFFYVNPMEVVPENCMERTDLEHVKPVRQEWFGCACCPPNIARTLAGLGEYLFFRDGDDLRVNMLVSGVYNVSLGGKDAVLTIASGLPYRGEATLTIKCGAPGRMLVRVPGYAENVRLEIDGAASDIVSDKGYAVINVSGDTCVRLSFDMPARAVYANPRLHADNGKCAVRKGPLVYCLEEADNGKNLAELSIDTKAPFTETWDDTLFGGVTVIEAAGTRSDHDDFGDGLYGETPPKERPVRLRYVPYCGWGNRGPGEMRVWIRYK